MTVCIIGCSSLATSKEQLRKSPHFVSDLPRVVPNSADIPVYDRILCPDGRVGLLNDNFCDCDDGSDETLTSACSMVLVGKPAFRCGNGKFIFLSRVHDLVSDCNDNADELDAD